MTDILKEKIIIRAIKIYKKLTKLSENEDRTISGQINKILKDYFKESK